MRPYVIGCLPWLAVAAAIVAPPAGAQKVEDARAGLELARIRCAECHAVERGNQRSIRPTAPAFSVIASSPGISVRALAALLQTSHRDMPDIMLDARERADVIAYILTLRNP